MVGKIIVGHTMLVEGQSNVITVVGLDGDIAIVDDPGKLDLTGVSRVPIGALRDLSTATEMFTEKWSSAKEIG